MPSRRSGYSFGSRISALVLAMVATMATIYVSGRLWQDAENRVYLIQKLDKGTGQGHSAISVDDTLKIITCSFNMAERDLGLLFTENGSPHVSQVVNNNEGIRSPKKKEKVLEQHKKLSALEMDLAAARQEGFVTKHLSVNEGRHSTKRLLSVIGIITTFGRKKNRDAIRKAWMPTGAAMKNLADQKGLVVRFVIGRSANREDSLDKETETENSQTNDFIILDNQVEAPGERSKKIKSFFIHAVDNWDAEFYVKVNDDVFVNLDALGAVLASHLDKPRVYIGCMKSGEVFSELTHKWYEPDWWKFGDRKSYFQHASGEIYVISKSLAQFISTNGYILRTYAHDDVSVGSWFIGLDVKHINERKFCCSSWSSGAICAAV